MNNKVIFAAAGNGKTYNLCKEAINLAKTSKKYILLISYTHEGVISIEKEYKIKLDPSKTILYGKCNECI